jgi:hypothetical protein
MDVKKNIQNMLVACNAVNKGEKFLIVANNSLRPTHLGLTLLGSLLEMGFEATLAVILPRKVAGAEPTAAVGLPLHYGGIFGGRHEHVTFRHTGCYDFLAYRCIGHLHHH